MKSILTLSALPLAFGLALSTAHADNVVLTSPLILDLDDLSFDLARYQYQGIDSLDFAGPLPVPQDVTLATQADFSFVDDGAQLGSITTNASANYVLSPGIAARVTYMNQQNFGANTSDRNILQVDTALNTNCMGRFDVVGQLDADNGKAQFKSLTWHIPKFGAC